MLRRVEFTRELETLPEMVQAGRAGQAVKVIYQAVDGTKHIHTTSAGQGDKVLVYREGELVYVLSLNIMLNYVGIEVFQGDELIGEYFWQYNWDIRETFQTDDIGVMDRDEIAAIAARHVDEVLA